MATSESISITPALQECLLAAKLPAEMLLNICEYAFRHDGPISVDPVLIDFAGNKRILVYLPAFLRTCKGLRGFATPAFYKANIFSMTYNMSDTSGSQLFRRFANAKPGPGHPEGVKVRITMKLKELQHVDVLVGFVKEFGQAWVPQSLDYHIQSNWRFASLRVVERNGSLSVEAEDDQAVVRATWKEAFKSMQKLGKDLVNDGVKDTTEIKKALVDWVFSQEHDEAGCRQVIRMCSVVMEDQDFFDRRKEILGEDWADQQAVEAFACGIWVPKAKRGGAT